MFFLSKNARHLICHHLRCARKSITWLLYVVW